MLIERADPTQPAVRALLAELDGYLHFLYPPSSNYILDPAQLQGLDVTFLVAREGEDLLGCVALRSCAGYGEVKRMMVSPRARGKGLGRALLNALEQHAVAQGIPVLRLETGIHQPDAIRLYHANGFTDISHFGNYPDDPLSRFMEKSLAGR